MKYFISFCLTCAIILGCVDNLFCQVLHENNSGKSYYIHGAMVYDGISVNPNKVNVLISEGKIVLLDSEETRSQGLKNAEYIDASGLVLAPGFIDPHTHLESDLSSPDKNQNLSALFQGVTTVFAGNDGGSPFPIDRSFRQWTENGIGTNVALFVGHGTVRRLILGIKDVQPDSLQLEKMKSLIAQAMEEGAFGMSTGLFYAPGSFAKSEEVIELAKVAASYGGIYDTHIRDESSYSIGLIESIKETLDIGRKANIPLHFSHIKALGSDVWGFSGQVIEMIEQAKNEGLEITANQYPYIASRTSLIAALIPRWAEDGGYDALLERLEEPSLRDRILLEIKENIRRRGGEASLIISAEDLKEYHDHSLDKLSDKYGMPAEQLVIEILQKAAGVRVVSFNMKESDLIHFMKQDWVFTGSDGVVGHPRKFGSFSRKIEKYVIQDQVISLGEMIKKSSWDVAFHFGIKDRGAIKQGFHADVIIFDPTKIKENASFQQPSEYSEGMEYVFVNGKLVVNKGEFSGELVGITIRKNQQ
ncbi:amidohydrolase family protein [Belliella sp. R4-6]|uniref:Amidohydrolase family protein n=1 Tax=Belliella alkalica TaxID=1730871 RepID=A0ABS9VHC4_9BACT|nr:amidohydrolase family protein [Belliella alkalica]MCH7415826.1 amidohydrolase family protein [Belliella alkalica]